MMGFDKVGEMVDYRVAVWAVLMVVSMVAWMAAVSAVLMVGKMADLLIAW